jgi:hypothetical protein
MRRHLSVALFILFSLPLAGQTFPQRVAAGDVRSDSIVLWARLRPTIIELAVPLGLVSPSQKAFYDTLPVAPDADDAVNDKDDFLKALINANLAQLGYDPIGLAGSPINGTLLQGDPHTRAHRCRRTRSRSSRSSR